MQVIDETFPSIEQANHPFIPEGRSRCGNRPGPVGMANPFRAARFVARGPRLRRCVVGLGVPQFEAGAGSVSLLRPTARIGILHGVRGIAVRIDQHQSLPGVGEFPFEGTEDLDARIFRAKEPWVFSDEQQLSGLQCRAGGESEADAFGESPA